VAAALAMIGLVGCTTGTPSAGSGAPAASSTTGATAPTASASNALSAALARATARTGAPGSQAAVWRCGQEETAAVYGTRDKQPDHPVTSDTRFVVESTTKVATATMVLEQVEAGRVSLSEPIADFYPQLPDAGSITVEELLRMTSGLPDYDDDPGVARHLTEPQYPWSRDELVAALHRMLFTPGTRYRYTNSNFVVLGGVIEKAGHTSIEAAFESGIAAKAGLQKSSFTSPARNSPLFAHPFPVGDDGSTTDAWVPGFGISTDNFGPVWTDGGLASTAEDLARFGDALFGGRILDAPTLRAMTTLDKYGGGLGLDSQSYDGHSWIGHSGSYGGFESEMWFDAADGTTISVTTNHDESASASDTTSDVIWQAVVSAYLGAPHPAGPCR